jgi:hypothetical protein
MKIDSLFEQARKSKPLLDIKEVNTLLSSPKLVKKTTYTKMAVKGVVVASVILGITYLFLPKQEEQPTSIIPAVSKQQEQTLTTTEENPVLRGSSASKNVNKSVVSLETDKKEPKTKAAASSKPINMAGLKVLELTPSQLSKMGIIISGVIRVPYQITNDSLYTTIGYSSKGTHLDFSIEYRYKNYKEGETKEEVKSMEIKDQGNEIPLRVGKEKFGNNVLQGVLEKERFIEPVLVTDDLGVHWRSYRYANKLTREDYDDMQRQRLTRYEYDKAARQIQEAENTILNNINTLIPILVRTNREDTTFKGIGNHQWRPDVILWYEPSEALFSLLPQEIADEIRKECTAIQRHEGAPSCKHFESCQIKTGKISTYTIFPNPCENELNLTMNTEEDRNFTISLHDISGHEVKNFGEQVWQAKGEKEYRFSLDGLNSGMYMLLVTSSMGEYIVQRIIKK